MDNNFDDYEIAKLERMTAQNRNNNVVNSINNANSIKSTWQRDNVKPVKSTGHKNNVKPVRFTGHIGENIKSKPSLRFFALGVVGAFLMGGVYLTGRPSNPHELTANELKALSSNSENFNRLNLSSDDLQSVIDFSNKYQAFYEKVQDKGSVLSDDDIHELQDYLDTYKTLSKSVIADKVSSVTDVDAKDIIVVDSSRDFPFVTIAVRGKDNGGTLLNVGQRFNNKPLPTTLRKVAQNFVDLHNASVEFNISEFHNFAESLYGALGNLNTFAGTELIYDGRNFKEIYFDKDAYSHQNNLNKSHVDNSIQSPSDSITYASYENDDMDR